MELVPGVFGVFTEPNEAKAPLPKPNAEDAPADGDFADEGVIALKGFVFPCDDVSPNRRLGKDRGESSFPPSLPSVSFTANDNLPVLILRLVVAI